MLGELESATAAMADAGILVDSSPLQPPQTATTVRVRDGEMQLSDGPFAEIKEQLGGYFILDCEDLDTALRYAAMIPVGQARVGGGSGRDGCRRRIRGALDARAAQSAGHHRPGRRARRGTRTDRGDLMDVNAALQSQIRNIEATYGKPLDHWFAVIDASGPDQAQRGRGRMLKTDHGLAHGAAHRVSLLARQRHGAG